MGWRFPESDKKESTRQVEGRDIPPKKIYVVMNGELSIKKIKMGPEIGFKKEEVK